MCAVFSDRGLVVPILRNTTHSLAQVGRAHRRFRSQGQDGQAVMKDMTGGTFTISTVGCIIGSLLSSPIRQPPAGADSGCAQRSRSAQWRSNGQVGSCR